MSALPPIYEDHEHRYQADTCESLVQAASQGRVRLEALVRSHYPGRKLPSGELAGVKSVGYWDAPTEQDWGLDWHRNEGIELTLLETGRVGFAAESKSCHLRADDLTITRPWQCHRVGDPKIGASRLHWLILDVGVRQPDQPWHWPDWIVLTKPDLQQLTDFLRQNDEAVWRGASEIRDCFRKIAAAVQGDRDGDCVSRLTILLNQLLLLVLEVFRNRNVVLDESLTGKQQTVDLFLGDLQKRPHLLAREWSVKLMAGACGLGETRFSHYCRVLTNATPLQYLNQLRLEAAADLLQRRPDLGITEVAMACGFASSQYFATSFKRHFGYAPSQQRSKRPDDA